MAGTDNIEWLDLVDVRTERFDLTGTHAGHFC
jgi:hypothetical protein